MLVKDLLEKDLLVRDLLVRDLDVAGLNWVIDRSSRSFGDTAAVFVSADVFSLRGGESKLFECWGNK